MTPRVVLFTTTSVAGLLLARALDGFGLLPGVTESEAVRRSALDPRWTAVGLLGCLVVGHVASRLLNRGVLPAVACLVVGQLAVVMTLEEAARTLSGAPKAGGETGLWVSDALQLGLALLAVTTALLVLSLVVGLHEARVVLEPSLAVGLPPYRVVLLRTRPGGQWGRAPPYGC